MVFSLKKKCISSAWYGSHIIIIFWNVHVNGQSHCQVQGKCERVCLSCLLEIGRGNHFQLWESGFFIGSRCFDCYYTLAGRVLCNTVVWCMGAVASQGRHVYDPDESTFGCHSKCIMTNVLYVQSNSLEESKSGKDIFVLNKCSNTATSPNTYTRMHVSCNLCLNHACIF